MFKLLCQFTCYEKLWGFDSIVFNLESKNLLETINVYHLHRPEEREREQPIAKTIWSAHSLPQVLKLTGIIHLLDVAHHPMCTLKLRSIQIYILVAPDMYPLSKLPLPNLIITISALNFVK